MTQNTLAFKYHHILLGKIATLVGSSILKKYNDVFKMDDLEALEDHYSSSTQTVVAGPYEFGEMPFYVQLDLYRTAGKKSERSVIYRMDMQAFSQHHANTPKFVNAEVHMAISQRQRQGTGKPNSQEELLEFIFTPHPVTATTGEEITMHSSVAHNGDDEASLNPLAKDLADQILMHV